MTQPALKLLLIALLAHACGAPQPDGAAVIAAACEERDRDGGMSPPATDELRSFVEGMEFPNLPYRFSATYDADDEEAAVRLAAWWSTRTDLTTRVSTTLPSTPDEVETILATGVTGLEIGCDTVWSVHVATPPRVLTREWVASWVPTLDSVPVDSAWRLAGWSISDP